MPIKTVTITVLRFNLLSLTATETEVTPRHKSYRSQILLHSTPQSTILEHSLFHKPKNSRLAGLNGKRAHHSHCRWYGPLPPLSHERIITLNWPHQSRMVIEWSHRLGVGSEHTQLRSPAFLGIIVQLYLVWEVCSTNVHRRERCNDSLWVHGGSENRHYLPNSASRAVFDIWSFGCRGE